MKSLPMNSLWALAMSGALLAVAETSQAQNLVFSEDWETDHSSDGTYITNFTATGVSLADLYFDYSLAGVPLSPNSSGVSTRALKMAVDLQAGGTFPIGVSVSPVGFGITDNFDMHFDMWFNYNGPFTVGGSGSTQIGGAGYGTAGTTAQVAGVADSVFIGGSTDGNTASDFRVYSSAHTISYQAGSYRIGSSGSDPAILGDPSSGFVYAGTGGSRDSDNSYYVANYPAQQCPADQFLLYPQQTNSNGTLPGQPGFCKAGALSFKWHDVSLQKIANVITYKIDGFLVATVDVVDAGALGGSNILFNMYDINNGASTDPNRTNLIFTLIDNVRVTNFANVVSVTATTPSTGEGSASDAVFTIMRTATGVPITVNYTLTGSAVNGVDYTSLPGSVTLAAAATSTNIFVHPIDDPDAETTESVILNITPDPNFVAGGSATVTISDNEPPQLAITNVSKQMYERTNDFATFRMTRLGNTNAASFNANLSFSGTATSGVDYYTNTIVTFEPGVQSTNFNVYPIVDSAYEGNETVTVNIAAAGGGEYTIAAAGSASITLVDADGPAETVLFSDNFNTDSSANWNLFYAATNSDVQDYTATFAFDYSLQNIPPAPHGSGDTHGLFLTVNKDPDANSASAAALNLYPIGQSFSGNFALRFDMFLNVVPGASSTEYALFGINHSGTKTNWWRSGGVPAGWMFDGIFYAVENDAQSAGADYVLYSSPTTAGNNPTNLTAGANVTAFTDAFKSPPWVVAGGPAMNATNNTPVWSDVEVSKIGNIVTLRINHTTIFSYTNDTPYTSGNIMIGYDDAFNSLGSTECYVVYDNVRVVSLMGLRITAIQDLGANVQLDFTFDVNDTPSSFKVQSASVVSGPYADTAATIVQFTPGTYRATVAKSGGAQFYRIRHL